MENSIKDRVGDVGGEKKRSEKKSQKKIARCWGSWENGV
jgi:hypothetical protein